MANLDIKQSLQPIYLGVAFWGRGFRESFINYCLASLLGEGNIPALDNATGENRFLIYTSPEDWAWVEAQPLLYQLKRYMKVEFTPIDFISEEEFLKQNNPIHLIEMYQVTQAHRAIVSRMYTDQAVGGITYPNTIYAKHALSSSYQHIIKGKTAVLIHFPRFATMEFTNGLKYHGYFRVGESISVAARDLIRVALQYLHIDLISQQWELPCLPEVVMELAWPLPKNSGFLFHGFCMCCVFINYSQLATHQVDCLHDNTINGTYLYRNVKKEAVHLITDSDEVTAISFSQHINRKLIKIENNYFSSSKIRDFKKISYVKQTIKYAAYRQTDPLKLHFSKYPIYLHAEDLTDECFKIGKKSQAIVKKILGSDSLSDLVFLSLVNRIYDSTMYGKIVKLFNMNRKVQKFFFPPINFLRRSFVFGFILLLVMVKYIFNIKKRKKPLLFPICIEKIEDPHFKGPMTIVRAQD